MTVKFEHDMGKELVIMLCGRRASSSDWYVVLRLSREREKESAEFFWWTVRGQATGDKCEG